MNKTVKRLLTTGAGLAGLAIANNAVFARAQALGNILGGEGRFWPGPYGDLFYTRQGKGPVVVLLHGIYAGASSYEWRKNFDSLSEHFTVYALDWLGFGLSDKPRIRYTAPALIEQLVRFLAEVVGEPANIAASSLGAAYAVQAAADNPESVRGLILACPTGFQRLASEVDVKTEALYQILHCPLAGTTFYNGITSQASLRWYLMNQTYFDPSYVDDAMIAHYTTATHQYGSQNALPAFVSGLLNHNIADAFASLTQKTIRVAWGREARMTPLSDAEAFLAANGKAELTVFDKCGLLPHDEQAQGFNRLVVELFTQKQPRSSRSRSKTAEEPSTGIGEGD